jgi:hypothetical protein
MDARQKALFRNNILTQLHDAAPSAVPADIIAQGARLAGFARRRKRSSASDICRR